MTYKEEPGMTVKLVQFRFSPYNEKARWALDFKGIKHIRQNVLPGPHMLPIKRLSGQNKTPVLILEGKAIFNSADIVAALEKYMPQPNLHFAEPELQARAMQIQKRFDDEWGPRIRRAVLDAFVGDAAYTSRVFGGGFLYASIFPFARGIVKKGNGITGPESVADGIQAAKEAFAFVRQEAVKTGYLVGDRFSVADLTAASHLAPCIDPPHLDMERPKPMPQSLSNWLAEWRKYPGAEWVQKMYRQHRPQPCTN
jgi:glutathione S-transferase